MFSHVLNILFPPQCAQCRAPVERCGSLCQDCWQQIHFISDPVCAVCGMPFEYSIGDEALCGQCIHTLPHYTAARAVMRYDATSRRLITQLKYSDQTQLAATYGLWMHASGKRMIDASEVLVPVPLHYFRFIARRYNQSALLAYALAKECKLPVVPDALKRIRHTPPQASLNRRKRLLNVKNAFAPNPARINRVWGKNILLIDDVMTTSATIHACTRALLQGGAKEVRVLTLARRW